jgi:hypothetical protein
VPRALRGWPVSELIHMALPHAASVHIPSKGLTLACMTAVSRSRLATSRYHNRESKNSNVSGGSGNFLRVLHAKPEPHLVGPRVSMCNVVASALPAQDANQSLQHTWLARVMSGNQPRECREQLYICCICFSISFWIHSNVAQLLCTQLRVSSKRQAWPR